MLDGMSDVMFDLCQMFHNINQKSVLCYTLESYQDSDAYLLRFIVVIMPKYFNKSVVEDWLRILMGEFSCLVSGEGDQCCVGLLHILHLQSIGI